MNRCRGIDLRGDVGSRTWRTTRVHAVDAVRAPRVEGISGNAQTILHRSREDEGSRQDQA